MLSLRVVQDLHLQLEYLQVSCDCKLWELVHEAINMIKGGLTNAEMATSLVKHVSELTDFEAVTSFKIWLFKKFDEMRGELQDLEGLGSYEGEAVADYGSSEAGAAEGDDDEGYEGREMGNFDDRCYDEHGYDLPDYSDTVSEQDTERQLNEFECHHYGEPGDALPIRSITNTFATQTDSELPGYSDTFSERDEECDEGRFDSGGYDDSGYDLPEASITGNSAMQDGYDLPDYSDTVSERDVQNNDEESDAADQQMEYSPELLADAKRLLEERSELAQMMADLELMEADMVEM